MLEEVDDIDNMDFDPADFDPRKGVIQSVTPASSSSSSRAPPAGTTSASGPGTGMPPRGFGPPPGFGPQVVEDASAFKDWQIIYPVYFDARRSQSEGRRVSLDHAVENPLARTIVDACAYIGVQVFFEPQKIHPKDWANPGRVRVNLRDPETKIPLNPKVKNKRHLYNLISEYLKKHPTTREDPLKLPLPGMNIKEVPEKPAVPRGWKMNDVVPLHSAALTGGGVSDNIFKDLPGMEGMGSMPGMPGMGGMPGLGGMGLEGLKGLANGKIPPQLASQFANLPGGLKGLESLANSFGGLGGLGGLGGMGGIGGLGGAGPSRGGKSVRGKGRK
ncbi:signal recognition particle, SRP19 subunit [Dipodascopsis uninucleata]